MLTELKLTNFRIFDDEVTVRFRPITILIGRNSSGKSTVIKFLLMLQQSLGIYSSQFIVTDGDNVNLGVFSELKNALTAKADLRFSLTANDTPNGTEDAVLEYLNLLGDGSVASVVSKANATVSYSGRGATGSANYSLFDDGEGRELLSAPTGVSTDTRFLGYSPPWRFDLPSPISSAAWLTPDSFNRRDQKLERDSMQGDSEFHMMATLRFSVSSLRHLASVRAEMRRVIELSSPPTDYVGQRGQFTLSHLQRMLTEDHEKYDFLLPHLGSVADVSGVEFRMSPGYISRPFATNSTTGADVPVADFGFGVSQSLPVLVQGAIMEPYTTLMVEQPEAQLHPTAQLEMGGFFADLWNKRKVCSIIETHSDNILLRLRRLIAKGDLSHKDVSIAYFTFDEERGNMPTVKNLDINEDGSLQPGLPMMFFGADIEEGFLLGARE